MNKILICLFLVFCSITDASAMDNEHQLYAELLTRNNTLHVKVAAQSIYNKTINDIELTDIAAETLGQSVNKKINLNVDTQAWLAKAIGASGSQRYSTFFEKTLKLDISSKLKKHIRKSLNNLTKTSNESFILGQVDLDVISNTIREKNDKYISIATQEKFNNVHTGDTINQIFEQLGKPNNIEVVFGTKRQHWAGNVSYSMLKFNYENIGRLNLYFSKKAQRNWLVRQVLPNVSINNNLDQHPIMNESPLMVRAYIKDLVQQVSATDLDRELIAERLYRDLNNEDFADTLSWGCRLLGLSGEGRYRSVLENTIANSSQRKLQKYARKFLKKLPKADVEQYQQGSVFK